MFIPLAIKYRTTTLRNLIKKEDVYQ